jgi:hypothetical protein
MCKFAGTGNSNFGIGRVSVDGVVVGAPQKLYRTYCSAILATQNLAQYPMREGVPCVTKKAINDSLLLYVRKPYV